MPSLVCLLWDGVRDAVFAQVSGTQGSRQGRACAQAVDEAARPSTLASRREAGRLDGGPPRDGGDRPRRRMAVRSVPELYRWGSSLSGHSISSNSGRVAGSPWCRVRNLYGEQRKKSGPSCSGSTGVWAAVVDVIDVGQRPALVCQLGDPRDRGARPEQIGDGGHGEQPGALAEHGTETVNSLSWRSEWLSALTPVVVQGFRRIKFRCV